MRVVVIVHASVAAIEIMSLSINLEWRNGITLLHFFHRENIVPQSGSSRGLRFKRPSTEG